MRLAGLSALLPALIVAACGGRAADPGPAWPKSAGWPPAASWEEDGGEPLAPRWPHAVAVEASASPAPTGPAPEVEVEIEIPATTTESSEADDFWFEWSPDDTILIEGELSPDEP